MDEPAANPAGECFYNYFYLGFDVLLSTPAAPSVAPIPDPSRDPNDFQAVSEIRAHTPDRLVATKIVLHGNIPGSYEFNRHRRCRWEINYLQNAGDGSRITSESPFPQIEDRLSEKWGKMVSKHGSLPRQRGMVLNRGWGENPGSSDLLGASEEGGGKRMGASGDSTTTLYGFPGLVFEVLKNGFVNTLTIF